MDARGEARDPVGPGRVQGALTAPLRDLDLVEVAFAIETELAKRCPHARWGTIAVREIGKMGPDGRTG